MKILIKFASRSRPQKFFNCLDNIISNCTTSDYRILASLDVDDGTMNNELVIERMKKYDKLDYFFGFSKNKIDAVNRDMDLSGEWDILINTSDDMWFVQKGFDEHIIKAFEAHYPDLDGVIHYNDSNQRDNMITMAIMGRKYYERFNYIYHPSYESLFADNEQMDVAKSLSKIKYMGDDKILFHHNHPAWSKCEYDAQYLKTESRDQWDRDEKNYNKRKQLNFIDNEKQKI